MAPAAGDRLLVVEDDEGLRRQLRWSLEGYHMLQAEDREGAIAALRAQEPPVVLLDLGLPPDPHGVGEGFATLETILTLAPTTKVVVMAGQEARAHAVRAVGMGAYDYYQKPVEADELGLIVARAFHLAALEAESRRLLAIDPAQRLSGVIGLSPAMQEVCRMVEKVAPADVSVVLLGESGTGKELLARAVHDLSPRRQGPFVAINCAAIPENLLESELFGHQSGAFTGAIGQTPGEVELASGGTLFLDEIGDLPLPLQVNLLRSIRERVVERIGERREIPVDLRLVCATHRNVPQLVATGAFRGDLYYRLAEVVINIPPLRRRAGDAVLLALHLLSQYNAQLGRSIAGFSEDAVEAIDAHAWPGNVRELQNRMKRAVIMAGGKRITAADLELRDVSGEPEPLNLREVRERAETEALRRALAQTSGNISRTARLLGISRPTLYDLMRQHNLRA